MRQHVLPIEGQVIRAVPRMDDYGANEAYEVDHIDDADVITSEIVGSSKHKLIIDLDLPAKLIPSSTEGHFHLYVDHAIPAPAYWKLLEALEGAGLIEAGYLGASQDRGYTAVRLPWVKKRDAEPTCGRCHRPASEIATIVDLDDYESAAEWAMDDGTYNSRTNHFYCDVCYIALGQPLGVAA